MKGYKIISLSEFERRAWLIFVDGDFLHGYNEDLEDYNASLHLFSQAVHTYNLLLSRKVEEIDLVRPEVMKTYKYEAEIIEARLRIKEWQSLFIGKDIEFVIGSYISNSLNAVHLTFNPLHPVIVELENILKI